TVSVFQKVNTTPQWSSIDNVNHSIILNISIDKYGSASLSTPQGGVMILYPKKGSRRIVRNNTSGTKDQSVTARHTDPENGLLLGRLAAGLIQSGSDGIFKRLTKVPAARVNAIKAYGDFLFIGTNEGLLIVKDSDFDNALERFP